MLLILVGKKHSACTIVHWSIAYHNKQIGCSDVPSNTWKLFAPECSSTNLPATVRSCGTVGLSQRFTLSTFITNFIIDIHLVMKNNAKKGKFNCNSQEITSIVITRQDYNNCWLLFISYHHYFDCRMRYPIIVLIAKHYCLHVHHFASVASLLQQLACGTSFLYCLAIYLSSIY